MNEYTFPFNTCEKTNTTNIIAQPWSSFFNFINCLIIFWFLLKTKTIYSFFLLLSIFLFELFHLFSHIIHIQGSIQTNTTHFLTYLINIAFLYTFYSYTKKFPNLWFILYLLLLVLFDIYALFNLNIVFYILSQATIMISLLLYYLPFLPKPIQQNLLYIIILISIIILLFINEKYNCKSLLSIYPNFPFHILIEIAGIILFYIICNIFHVL